MITAGIHVLGILVDFSRSGSSDLSKYYKLYPSDNDLLVFCFLYCSQTRARRYCSSTRLCHSWLGYSQFSWGGGGGEVRGYRLYLNVTLQGAARMK